MITLTTLFFRLFRNGAEIQKISALSHITVVKRFSSGQKNKIVQMILDQMQQGERGFEFTLSCARIFCELVDEGVVETSTIDCALPSLRKLLESKDPEVQAVWADAMIVAIRHMSLQLLETEV